MQAIVHALRVPGFARLASTYALNELADWTAAIALSILVFDATGSPWATTALFLANKFAPGLIVPALTAHLERYAAGRLLAGVYVLEAAGLVALAWAAGSFWLPLVLALALADGALAALARATTRGATPALMEPHGRLREANATLNVGFAGMNALGPIAAGGLVAVWNPRGVLVIAAAVFLAQAAIIGGARLKPGEAQPAPWRMRLREAAAYVRERPVLRILLLAQLAVVILATMVTPIEVILAKETLDAGDVGVGALASAWGVGMLAGSALFAREHGRSILLMAGAATAAVAVGYLWMAAAPDIVVACLGAALGGLGNGVQFVAVITAIQEATEERFQGRVAGLTESVLTLGPGVGFPLGGAVTAIFSPRAAFAVAGGGILLLLGIAGMLIRPRHLTPTPAPVPAAPVTAADTATATEPVG